MFESGNQRGLLAEAGDVSKPSTSALGGSGSIPAPTEVPTIWCPEPFASSGLGSIADSVGASVSLEAKPRQTVCSLRDRLVQEAMQERHRCLEVAKAAERRRGEFRGLVHTSTQTDPVTFAADVSASASNGASPSVSERGCGLPAADGDDDEEQMEAIRALVKLGELGQQSQCKEARVSELSREVQNERQHREEAHAELAMQRSCRESTQEQVICLEKELDSRESALQAVQTALERRTAELQQALLHMRALEEGYGRSGTSGRIVLMNDECRHLRSQLNEKEHLVDLKDRHIARLLAELRTRGVFFEGVSTYCGSEKSVAMTASTATSMAQISAF